MQEVSESRKTELRIRRLEWRLRTAYDCIGLLFGIIMYQTETGILHSLALGAVIVFGIMALGSGIAEIIRERIDPI